MATAATKPLNPPSLASPCLLIRGQMFATQRLGEAVNEQRGGWWNELASVKLSSILIDRTHFSQIKSRISETCRFPFDGK